MITLLLMYLMFRCIGWVFLLPLMFLFPFPMMFMNPFHHHRPGMGHMGGPRRF